jgi:hypothetical protein
VRRDDQINRVVAAFEESWFRVPAFESGDRLTPRSVHLKGERERLDRIAVHAFGARLDAMENALSQSEFPTLEC